MDDSLGDTSHLTTQDELSSTNQVYLLMANGGRPHFVEKVQFCTILGQKWKENFGALCL